ncbi:MAG TPA: FUSC family protein, partial [Chitinophagaceae bacterium]|nr:FUSC family protein [Chitinophagaceae bacterium]
FLGVVIGALVLLLIKNNLALLVVMIFFMATSYVFLRTSYFTSVLFMTPYLVIFFHLLYPGNLRIVLTDRVLDTAIGSGISFLASIFFVPQWEHTTIKMVMEQMLESNKRYYTILAKAFSGNRPLEPNELHQTRRDVLVALANLSDAFTRMLSEPKRFQKGMEAIHQFVALNHTLTSHLSTLSYYLNVRKNNFRSADVLPVIENTVHSFNNAIDYLQERKNTTVTADKSSLKKLNELADYLLEKRKKEISLRQFETETKIALVNAISVIDQFNSIFIIAADIYKSSKKIQVASS